MSCGPGRLRAALVCLVLTPGQRKAALDLGHRGGISTRITRYQDRIRAVEKVVKGVFGVDSL